MVTDNAEQELTDDGAGEGDGGDIFDGGRFGVGNWVEDAENGVD